MRRCASWCVRVLSPAGARDLKATCASGLAQCKNTSKTVSKRGRALGRTCSVCLHPRAAEINEQLVNGLVQNKAIAVSTGLNVSAVSRHRRVCLQPVILSDADQLKLLMGRSEELWLMSAGSGDVRAMAQSIQSSLRALEFQLRHREDEAQGQAARDLPDDLRQWTDAEGARMMKFLDHIISSTSLPSPEEYAARCGSQFQGEREKHEHNGLIPIRN